MLIIDINMGMIERISDVAIDPSCRARCREMLAGPPQGSSGGMHGMHGVSRGGDRMPTRNSPARTKNAGFGSGAGTSRLKGRKSKNGECGEGGVSSESD